VQNHAHYEYVALRQTIFEKVARLKSQTVLEPEGLHILFEERLHHG